MVSIADIARLWALPLRLCLVVLHVRLSGGAQGDPIPGAGEYVIEFYLDSGVSLAEWKTGLCTPSGA